MVRYLNHQYKLTLEVVSPPKAGQTQVNTTNSKVVFTDLQIKGTVKGSKSDAASNNLTLQIYNLSKDTIKKISQEDLKVTLDVGYPEQDLETLFIGNLLQISTSPTNGRDRVTTILAVESLSGIREGKSSRSWDHDVTVETIFKEIIVHDLGLSLGNIHNGTLPSTQGLKKVLKKYSTSGGSSKKILDELSKGHNLVWNITKGKVNVYPKGSGRSYGGEKISRYTPKTGLIKAPYKTIINSDKMKGSSDKKSGSKFEVILSPTLVAGSVVKVESESRDVDQEFIVKEVSHVFDFWKGKWQSNILGEDIDGSRS